MNYMRFTCRPLFGVTFTTLLMLSVGNVQGQETGDLLQSYGDVCPQGREMVIVAHADDDIIFMNPTIDDRIAAGVCMATVFLTAGDAGQDESYWATREAGAKAAHAKMHHASSQDWIDIPVFFNGHLINVSFLISQPAEILLFLRLPDGGQGDGTLPGPGFPLYNNVSLQKLWSGEIESMTAVDGSTSYTRQQLIDTLNRLMNYYQPSTLYVQDYRNEGDRFDHSDHVHAALFAMQAEQTYAMTHEVRDYLGYNISARPVNVAGEEFDRKLEVFLAYAEHDALVHIDGDLSKDIAPVYRHDWLPRQYQVGQENPGVVISGEVIGYADKCLDVRGPSSANGTPVQIWDCVGVANQQWELTTAGELRGFADKCLDVRGPSSANGTPVQMWDCVGAPNQQWEFTPSGELRGYAGKCLDVRGPSSENGTPVQIWDCVGVANQQWRIQP